MATSAHAVSLAVKELRQGLRAHVAIGLQNAYVLLVAGIAAVIVLYSSAEWQPAWQHGSTAFWAIVYTQAVLALIIGVSLTAASVTMEHEQKTYDTLLTTPLLPQQIVAGKLLGGLVAAATIFVLSLPVLAACFILGGVPISTAVWAWILLMATLLLAVALGLYCSVLTRRTIAAVPLAIGAAVVTAVAFVGFASVAPGLATFSPLLALRLLAYDQAIPFFGWQAPVWAVCLLAWVLMVAVLLLSAADLLRHPPLQRRLGIRLLLAMLATLAALLLAAALNLGTAQTPDDVPERLQGYITVACYLLLIAAAVFAAGPLTPLDRRRLQRQPLQGYSLGERLLGYSLRSGGNFLLLLAVLTCGILELGVLLSGERLVTLWGGRILLAFLPALAALWAFTILARLPAYERWPRTLAGRQFLAAVLIIILMLLPALPGMLHNAAQEPPATVELVSALSPAGGVAAALPTREQPYASAFMKSLAARVPIPLLSAGAHVLLGALLLLAEWGLIRRWRARML